MIRTFKLKSALLAAVAAVIFTVLSVTVYYTGAYAVYFGNTTRLVPIYSVEREDKTVAISDRKSTRLNSSHP